MKQLHLYFCSLEADDSTTFRQKIAREADHFIDLSQIPNNDKVTTKVGTIISIIDLIEATAPSMLPSIMSAIIEIIEKLK